MDADAIVVGAGLAGLVAAARATAAGRRVALLDQENAANLGGQAYWSFGGLFLVDSPEQRRLGVQGLGRAGLERLAGQRPVRPARRRGRVGGAVGPRVRRVRRRGEARLAGRARASRSCRPSAGPSAATCAPTGTATRCRASTSPGAPAPAWSSRSSPRPSRRPRPGCSPSTTGTGSTSWCVEQGAVTGVRGTVLAPDDAPRGVAVQPRPWSASSADRAGRRRHRRRDRREPRPRPAVLARAARHAAGVDGHRRAGVRGRADARHRRRGRRPAGQPGPDVALHRGRAELEPDLARARHPDPARPVVDVVRRARPPAAGAVPARLRHPRRRCGTCARRRTSPGTTTPGSC